MVKTRNINNLSSLAKWPDYSHDTLMYEYMCGPFQLIKKKVFDEIGYFDESFVSAGDYEMVAKMSKMKYKFRKVFFICYGTRSIRYKFCCCHYNL